MPRRSTKSKETMWAVMRDGAPYMILPTIDDAETHLGLLSLNGFSKHKWHIRKADVSFPHENIREQRLRLDRHVQAVVELNHKMAHGTAEK